MARGIQQILRKLNRLKNLLSEQNIELSTSLVDDEKAVEAMKYALNSITQSKTIMLKLRSHQLCSRLQTRHSSSPESTARILSQQKLLAASPLLRKQDGGGTNTFIGGRRLLDFRGPRVGSPSTVISSTMLDNQMPITPMNKSFLYTNSQKPILNNSNRFIEYNPTLLQNGMSIQNSIANQSFDKFKTKKIPSINKNLIFKSQEIFRTNPTKIQEGVSLIKKFDTKASSQEKGERGFKFFRKSTMGHVMNRPKNWDRTATKRYQNGGSGRVVTSTQKNTKKLLKRLDKYIDKKAQRSRQKGRKVRAKGSKKVYEQNEVGMTMISEGGNGNKISVDGLRSFNRNRQSTS